MDGTALLELSAMQTHPSSCVPVLPLIKAEVPQSQTEQPCGKCRVQLPGCSWALIPTVEGLSLAQLRQEQTQVQDRGAQTSSTPDPLASMATSQLLHLLVLGRDPLFLLSQ